jgi:hypothetical protein
MPIPSSSASPTAIILAPSGKTGGFRGGCILVFGER